MQRSIVVTAVVALAVGGVIGYWLGRPAAAPADAAAGGMAGTATPASGVSDTTGGWPTGPAPVAAKPRAGGVGGTVEEPSEGNADPRVAERVRDQALATVDQLAAVLSDPSAPGRETEIQALKQALLDKASNDTLALRGLISAFSADPNSELGAHLGSLLAEIKDPEVEAMAQQMARSGSPDQMKAGLAVLGELKIANPETLTLTRQILRQPYSDPDVLMGAIHAMPVMPVSQQESAETLGSLAQLASSHPNDGVRSNSLFKISEWAKDGEDLQPVVQALDPNRTPDDRISAAMALAQSTVVDDSLRQTLISRMTDPRELWEVRQYSATALERFKLSGRDYQMLETFRREQLDLQRNG